MEKFKKKVSVIIPAYDEGESIYCSLLEIIDTLNELCEDYEVIVVDDGSSDNTHREVVRVNSKADRVKVVKSKSHQGKGSALKYGFQFAKGDFIVFLDADLDLHPEQLNCFFDIMEKTKADVVIGPKRHPESKVNYPKRRRALSFFYHLIIFVLFRLSITDTQVGLKLFKYKVLKKILPRVLIKRYAFDLELLVNASHLGYKVAEAPITLNFTGTNHWGGIDLRSIYRIWLDTLAVFYRMYILKYYDKH